jgi:hypothetical protein
MVTPCDRRHDQRMSEFVGFLIFLWICVIILSPVCETFSSVPGCFDYVVLLLHGVLYVVAFYDLLGTERYYRPLSKQYRRRLRKLGKDPADRQTTVADTNADQAVGVVSHPDQLRPHTVMDPLILNSVVALWAGHALIRCCYAFGRGLRGRASGVLGIILAPFLSYECFVWLCMQTGELSDVTLPNTWHAIPHALLLVCHAIGAVGAAIITCRLGFCAIVLSLLYVLVFSFWACVAVFEHAMTVIGYLHCLRVKLQATGHYIWQWTGALIRPTISKSGHWTARLVVLALLLPSTCFAWVSPQSCTSVLHANTPLCPPSTHRGLYSLHSVDVRPPASLLDIRPVTVGIKGSHEVYKFNLNLSCDVGGCLQMLGFPGAQLFCKNECMSDQAAVPLLPDSSFLEYGLGEFELILLEVDRGVRPVNMTVKGSPGTQTFLLDLTTSVGDCLERLGLAGCKMFCRNQGYSEMASRQLMHNRCFLDYGLDKFEDILMHIDPAPTGGKGGAGVGPPPNTYGPNLCVTTQHASTHTNTQTHTYRNTINTE